MSEPYYVAFWSSVMDCWVVAHRIPGNATSFSVDVEGLYMGEPEARGLAKEMNDKRRAEQRALQHDQKLRGCKW